jgi:signal transduction histidine kinase
MLAMLFALTAASIIWGQQTLGVTMVDPLTLITEMMLGGALFGLIYGHYYGLSLTQRRQLQQKTQQLQQQNERLDEFSSMVSHDLRNPLNVAQGRLELFQRDGDRAHLEQIKDAHSRMETLIENILGLAQIQQATVDRQPTDIESVVNQCWGHVEADEGTLVTNLDGVIAADTGQLQRLFENLFRNAIEHGGETVTITVGELENGFYVEDDGPGIPEEDRDDVFESGFSTAADNTGFGLAIVANIVRAHDWSVAVAESGNGGARILVTDVEWVTRS